MDAKKTIEIVNKYKNEEICLADASLELIVLGLTKEEVISLLKE